jgi:hypothetical protein
MHTLIQHVAREFQVVAEAIDGDALHVSGLARPIVMHECVQRSFLNRTTVVQFEYAFANTPAGECEVFLAHTGAITRTGVQARVRRGDATMMRTLLRDAGLLEQLMMLDFTEFVLVQDSAGWRTHTTQMGASWVNMAFPRTSRYVPLGRAQVDALVNTLRRLEALLCRAEVQA